MKILKRDNKEFYKIMGPIFGSRDIERKTKDRFYDDEGKVWYIDIKKNKVQVVFSIKDGTIKNFYCDDNAKAAKMLGEVRNDIVSGIVPAIYEEVFASAKYQTSKHSTNFIKITGGKDDKRN